MQKFITSSQPEYPRITPATSVSRKSVPSQSEDINRLDVPVSDFQGANKAQRVLMELAMLVRHPLQDTFNSPCSVIQDAQLDADLVVGQREPIHVMPPNNRAGLAAFTILDGHRRAASLERLGKAHASVVVRHDLTGADAPTVEAYFLKFNVNRRHLDPLSIVKNLKRQAELRNRGPLTQNDYQSLDRQISNIVNISIRNAQRYLHAADAVPVIHDLFRRRMLTLTVAGQVGALDREQQQEIVEAIHGIADTKEIRRVIAQQIQKHSVSARPQKRALTPRAVRFIVQTTKLINALELENGHAYGPTMKEHLAELVRIQNTTTRLIADSKRPAGDLTLEFAGLVGGVPQDA